MAGKTFPHRRTHCGTKGGRPCDSRADAGTPTTLDELDAMKGSPWAPSGVLKGVLLDVPRPTLSRDDHSVEPDEERLVPRNMKITQDILKKSDTRQVVHNAGNCGEMSIPIRAWHTHKIVALELRQRRPDVS